MINEQIDKEELAAEIYKLLDAHLSEMRANELMEYD